MERGDHVSRAPDEIRFPRSNSSVSDYNHELLLTPFPSILAARQLLVAQCSLAFPTTQPTLSSVVTTAPVTIAATCPDNL